MQRLKTKTALAAVFCGVLLLGACTSSSKNETGAKQSGEANIPKRAKIIYSANLHGELGPCGCRSNPVGGIDRRWEFLKKLHTQGITTDNSLQVDSGDLFFQSAPTPPFLKPQWEYQAGVMTEAYNGFGMDAITPGDFDLASGLEFLKRLEKRARFKILSANLVEKKTMHTVFPSTAVFEKAGTRYGVFGIVGQAIEVPNDLQILSPIESAKKSIAELKRQKVDFIVALTHQGLEDDLALTKEVEGIDFLFGAHSQNMLQKPQEEGKTLIFEPSIRGQVIGVVAGGTHQLVYMDESLVPKDATSNPMAAMLKKAGQEIAKINLASDKELFGRDFSDSKTNIVFEKNPKYKTFTKCIECHVPQYAFYKTTQHFRAYQTLVGKSQNKNFDCLKCHTLGMNDPKGWNKLSELVQNGSGKSIAAESFAKSLPKMKPSDVAKVGKAFINVQCEHCHAVDPGHPKAGSGGPSEKTLETAQRMQTCLQCHTPEQAPGWYKNGVPDMAVLQKKLKSIACPAN